MASEVSQEPALAELPVENEPVKRTPPYAKELFTVTIGASLVLFLCLGGIVFYLKPEDDGPTPRTFTRFTQLPPKQDRTGLPITTPHPESSTATTEITNATQPTPTDRNQPSLHEDLLPADHDVEA
ncbi:uncharacterized protein LOC144094657 [Amblyomma americanum]